MIVRIKGKCWKIVEADLQAEDGACVDSERLIEIRRGQRPRNRMDTLIHELLHAVFWEMSETDVRKAAKVLTTGLWGDGWRRHGTK